MWSASLLLLSLVGPMSACGPDDIWTLPNAQMNSGCIIIDGCLRGTGDPSASCQAQTCAGGQFAFKAFHLEASTDCMYERLVVPFLPSRLCGFQESLINVPVAMGLGQNVFYLTDVEDVYPGFELCALFNLTGTSTTTTAAAATVNKTVHNYTFELVSTSEPKSETTGEPKSETTGEPKSETTGEPKSETTGEPKSEPSALPKNVYPDLFMAEGESIGGNTNSPGGSRSSGSGIDNTGAVVGLVAAGVVVVAAIGYTLYRVKKGDATSKSKIKIKPIETTNLNIGSLLF